METLKKITVLFLIVWFSFTFSLVVHESWHLFQFREWEIEQVCFLGFNVDVIEVNNEWRNFYSLGWVVPGGYPYHTEWDAYFISFGIMLVSILTLKEVLLK